MLRVSAHTPFPYLHTCTHAHTHTHPTLLHTNIHLTAYDVLSDSEKRRHYDMYGAEGPQASQGSPFDYDTFFTPGGGFGDHRFHFNFDNLFKDFFGEDNGDDSGFFQFHHTDSHNPHSTLNSSNMPCMIYSRFPWPSLLPGINNRACDNY